MRDEDLLQELVVEGLITQVESDKVKRDAFYAQQSAEDLIFDRRIVDEVKLGEAKSRLIGIPFKKVDVAQISDELLKAIPEETSRAYHLMPIEKSDNMLVVGMLKPDDEKAQEALRFIAKQQKLDLGVYLIPRSNLEDAWRRYSPYQDEMVNILKSITINTKDKGASGERVVGLEESVSKTEEAPIIKLVARTLTHAVEVNASDIHIEPQRQKLRIRFRVNGELQEVSSMPIQLHQPIISRIKVLSNLKIDETRVPQDGRFRSVIFGRDIDFRVATFPTAIGEKMAIRVLDPTVGLKGLSDLGMVGHNFEVLHDGIDKPYGMVLISGPTGSGKSTTLYSIMQELNKEDVNVVSLEDPVEYFVEGLNQSQVKPEIGYDFASGLRQILRQDPDIIMVGEIRDSETAALAVHAALTGHIVLSTIHTNNSIGVIPRLIDMKVDAFLLPPALNLVIAQRLVGKICQFCKKAESASPEVSVIIKRNLEKLGDLAETKFSEPYQVYRSPGCPKCKGKGVSGRLALFEVLRMTPELGQIISKSSGQEDKIFEEAKRQRMVTMRQDGVMKALKGEVTIEDVLRETEELW